MLKNILFIFAFVIANLSADPKWIPIEPLNFNENTKSDTNKSKPANKMLDNFKIIQNLLDTTRNQEESGMEGKKNWYAIDDEEEQNN